MSSDFQADIDAVQRIDAVPLILDVICRTTGMGFAAVARVTEDRWIACSLLDKIDFGLPVGGELKVGTTLCNEVRAAREPVVIDNVSEDGTYCGHPTPAMYGFQSYVSMPIVRRDGTFFGTLCAIDPRPARLKNTETVGMFKLFAALIAAQLDADQRLAESESRLTEERQFSDLREQLIAVLGHDLRNPLASIDAGTKLLSKLALPDRAKGIVDLMHGSVTRMASLIDDVLDFARGRLGQGIPVQIRTSDLGSVLEQVIADHRAQWPGRELDVDLALPSAVNHDSVKLSQLFSNLLGNAFTHGGADSAIRVKGVSSGGGLELSVANAGKPIPAEAMKHLFKPFYRASADPRAQGLGLGLYIASEIAKAHGGTLSVSSDDQETRFTFRMANGSEERP